MTQEPLVTELRSRAPWRLKVMRVGQRCTRGTSSLNRWMSSFWPITSGLLQMEGPIRDSWGSTRTVSDRPRAV